MDSWRDYVSLDAVLPVAGWLGATYLALRGLLLAKNDRRRRFEYGWYFLAAVLVAVAYWLSGVQTLRSNRELERSVKTLLALSGVSNGGVNQGLDQLIKRNLKPRQIIPTQEEVLTKQIELLKADIPKRIAVTTLPFSDDTTEIIRSIVRAFARNDVKVLTDEQTALSPQETGIMFTMPNPNDPSDFALRLRDAFGLAGIREIRFAPMDEKTASKYDFTIFVGPAALQ